jgi:hypothetical protein
MRQLDDDLDPRSRRLLEDGGFTWDRMLGVWCNSAVGKAISPEMVAYHGPEWLVTWICRPPVLGSD